MPRQDRVVAAEATDATDDLRGSLTRGLLWVRRRLMFIYAQHAQGVLHVRTKSC